MHEQTQILLIRQENGLLLALNYSFILQSTYGYQIFNKKCNSLVHIMKRHIHALNQFIRQYYLYIKITQSLTPKNNLLK